MKQQVSCEECEIAEMDATTWIVHREAHKAPVTLNYRGLSALPFIIYPDVGKILDVFGIELLQFVQDHTNKGDHGCLTGDCPHESQVECYRALVEDCALELREKENHGKERR